MDKSIREQIAHELRESISSDIACGFRSVESIIDSVVEMITDTQEGDYNEDLIEADAKKIAKEEMIFYSAKQATWPAITDCDRLDAAFRELEENDIVARQNAPCCGTCAMSEVGQEVNELLDTGRFVRGYTFYHEQSTQGAAAGGSLYLSFGAVEPDDHAAQAVGETIVEILSRHEFKPEWDGNIANCIYLPLVWRRRIKE